MLISSLKAQWSCWNVAWEAKSDSGAETAHYYPRKMGKWGLLNLEMGCGEEGAEGERARVKSATSQESFHLGSKSSLCFLALSLSPRLPTWLRASLPTSPCSLYSALRSFSICCWLPTCCLGNPSILCAELRGSGTFHSYLNWERGRQLGGRKVGEKSFAGATCPAEQDWARLTLRGGAAGWWELLLAVMWDAFLHFQDDSKTKRRTPLHGPVDRLSYWMRFIS